MWIWILIKFVVTWLASKAVKNLIKKPATWVWMLKTILPRIFKAKKRNKPNPDDSPDNRPDDQPKDRRLGWRLRKLLRR